MINHIISINTVATASMSQMMLATGVAVAYFLCLRSSEYVSKTVVPIEFMLTTGSHQMIACNKVATYPWTSIKLVKFSLLHAGETLAFQYGFLLRMPTVMLYLSSNSYIYGPASPPGSMMIRFSLIVWRTSSIVYCINKYNRRCNLQLGILV